MSEPEEDLMRSNACLVVAMCVVLATSTVWAAENAASRHHRHGRHVTHPAQAPTSERRVPAAESGWGKPYAHPGDGDDDGLSRDPDDCNKGCIDGNPG
jgi:hypothetical protein